MAAELPLRRANLEDADAIRDLTRASYAKYIPLIGREPLPMNADHAALIAGGEVWVLEENARLVAAIEMIPREDNLYIDNVVVSEANQGRGIGKGLLAFSETRARALGFDAMTLFTNERYTTLLELYARLGYVETHRVPVQGTDAVHMRKTLEVRP
jgi:GNAT superfamily N-acetyltransferase